jgi:parvulin-like peptidyl-prolyl isomerase
MRMLKEPLFIVLGIGILIFFIDGRLNEDSFDNRHIFLGKTEVENIANQWSQSIGRSPSSQELERLIDAYLDEEVLVREALSMGLDQNDVVIRRRLAQRARLLLEDRVAIEPAAPEEVLEYFKTHKKSYRSAEQISFSHIFFSPEERSDSRADAEAALTQVNDTNWKQFGDTFLLQNSYKDVSAGRIRRDFGSRFSTNLSKAESNRWDGPIQSVYGHHLVLLSSRVPPKDAIFEKVKFEVQKDLELERQNSANDAYFDQLRKQYTVEINR